jgi:hypothetical protein
VRAGHGWIAAHPESVPAGAATFTGAVQERDGWKRLRRALAGKAGQIEGPLPAWVRNDCRDGLFQFTDWPRMPPLERIADMADAISTEVQWPGCAQGVVLSSGYAVSLGANSPEAGDITADTNRGFSSTADCPRPGPGDGDPSVRVPRTDHRAAVARRVRHRAANG